ncbi:hypothetical protein XSR1_190013 [Xenorhabdus szentirmaii DSM 16338]|uniref:Uncharacterized protein n=1 Tax=Xenorhabdus szentirmaii DSM 16338 TaxID=1427518 RepID=W1IW79_9GAMM|nr:hypothetical protein XSR1_190013 [Xenorhabdus szentirmaii DSM 16338]
MTPVIAKKSGKNNGIISAVRSKIAENKGVTYLWFMHWN